MKRLFKWFVFLAFVALLATGISYMGMRFKVGRLLGESKEQFIGREITFGMDSIPRQGDRLAWRVTWSRVRLPQLRRATVWVSPTGTIIAVSPSNLEDHIETYLRTRHP